MQNTWQSSWFSCSCVNCAVGVFLKFFKINPTSALSALMLAALTPAQAMADSAFETLHQNISTMVGLSNKKQKPNSFVIDISNYNNNSQPSTYSEDDDGDDGNDDPEPIPYPDIPVGDGGGKVDIKDNDIDINDSTVGDEESTGKDTSTSTGKSKPVSPVGAPKVTMQGKPPIGGGSLGW